MKWRAVFTNSESQQDDAREMILSGKTTFYVSLHFRLEDEINFAQVEMKWRAVVKKKTFLFWHELRALATRAS